VALTVDGPDGELVLDADLLLVATGRRPNTDQLDAAAGGLALDDHGHLITDDTYRTSVPGVWALGDAANHFQLKHMANAEMRVVSHDLSHPTSPRRLPTGLAPHAVFSDPQVASVGLTETQAIEQGIDHVIAVRALYRYRLRVGAGGHDQLREGDRRSLQGGGFAVDRGRHEESNGGLRGRVRVRRRRVARHGR
jgi:pyruvate/2-oxoglutarate dehydrogenase complex dihydrolipoamide dehydrogenase (E3) component